MLAEKFFLVLETLRSHASDDKPDRAVSRPVEHIPIPQQVEKAADTEPARLP